MSLAVVIIGVIVFLIIIYGIAFIISKINSQKDKEYLHEKYINFPKLDKKIKSINENITSNYDRLTMDYSDVSYLEFEMYERNVENYGFEKNSKVRYDKDNTYIILEHNEKRQTLHVVFHIKKF